MKQQITVKQLDELNNKQLDSYKKWCEEKEYEYPISETKNTFPLLSIGQMIEYLKEKDDFLEIRYNGKTFDVRTRLSEEEDVLELVDALWEAVKEDLNK